MKDPKRSHFIQRFKFDVEIEKQEEAHAIQNDLSSIFNNRLKRLLDKILTEFDDSGYVTKIPKIEIDLGDFKGKNIEEEFVIRFEKEFRRAIKMRMADMRNPNVTVASSQGERIMMVPAQIEILTYFLTQGRLPVGAERMAGKIESLFWDLISDEPTNTLAMLKMVVLNSPPALKRLSSAFSDRLVTRVYQLAVNQNSVSIATYEKKVSEEIAKSTGKSQRLIQSDLRTVLLRHLLVEAGSSFNMKKLEEAVEEQMVKQYGEETQVVFKARKRKAAGKPEETTPVLGKERELAVELIAKFVKGEANEESHAAIMQAWEYLVSNDVASLKRVLAQKAQNPQDLMPLLAILPTTLLRDFVQRAATVNGLRLIQIAATVSSAHDLFAPSSNRQSYIQQAIYAGLLHAIVNDQAAAPTPQKAIESIKTHLTKLPDAPKELLKEWEKFDFVEPSREGKPQQKKDLEDSSASEVAKEAEVKKREEERKKKEKALNETAEERIEAQRKAEQELDRLAEEERNRPPMTPEERQAAAEKAKEEFEAAQKQQREWEANESQRLNLGEEEAAAKRDELISDEEFFKASKSMRFDDPSEEDGIEAIQNLETIAQDDELFSAPILASAESRADLVMYYLATGAAPWWAKRFIPLQVEMMIKTLIKSDPAAIEIAFQRVAKGLPPARYPQVAKRMFQLIEEKTFVQLMPLLAGDLGGFTVSIAMALEAALEMLPEGSTPAPSSAKEKLEFAYTHQLSYLMEYASSSPSPVQMLRYVMRQLMPFTKLAPRKMIEWMGQVVEAQLAKGIQRMAPVKSMIPKIFEGIEVAPPTSHSLTADALAFQRTLLDKKSDVQGQEESVAQARKAAEEAQAAEALAQREVELTEEEAKIQTELEQAVKEEEAIRRAEIEKAKLDGAQKSTEENESDEAEKDPLPESEESPDALKAKAEKENLENLGDLEGRDLQSSDETEERDKKEKDSQADQQAKGLKNRLDEVFNKTAEDKAAELPPVMELSPEEVEALGIGEEWVVEVIRYYLVHGSISPAATALYTVDAFKAEIRTAMQSGGKPMVRMLKEIIGNSNVRMRLLALGDDVVMAAITLVNVAASDRLVPYVKEVLELFKGTSSPISKAYILEHAVRHAMTLRTTFLPINYVKELFEFLAMQPNVKVKEVLVWTNRRLETSSSPIKESLVEMLDVVTRIEELRETRGRSQKPGEKKAPPPRIPKPFDEDIYISNGGIGILYLFLITLFKAFNMITEDRKAFVSRQAQIRAIHQIQYLCYKEIDSPEEKMVMAKLITGWGLQEPLEPLETPLNEDDIDTCEAILGMVCTQWGVMKNAGPEYLRKTFLIRDARLKQSGSDWVLRVEQNGIDILRNKIPWSTNPIRLPWLSFLIEIEWP